MKAVVALFIFVSVVVSEEVIPISSKCSLKSNPNDCINGKIQNWNINENN